MNWLCMFCICFGGTATNSFVGMYDTMNYMNMCLNGFVYGICEYVY